MINILEIGKILLKNLDKVFIVVLLLICGYFFFKMNSMERSQEQARVEAQNRIAELSEVVQESETTWSRLAQQSENTEAMVGELRTQSEQLAKLIESRDEQIAQLTTAVARIRPITVVIREGANQSEEPPVDSGQPPRTRVDFDTIYQEFYRIHGFTLTNPAEATVSLEFTRPVRFTVVTTQAEDLSWRTYLESDLPGLEIGEIESRVNPYSRPADTRSWEQDIYLGVFGGAAVTGNAGIFGAEVGYDFGAVSIGVNAGGVTYPGSTDFLVGGTISIAPFDL